ncbi:hypothetical protein ABIC27_004384 [Streptomyces sp. PvR034]
MEPIQPPPLSELLSDAVALLTGKRTVRCLYSGCRCPSATGTWPPRRP